LLSASTRTRATSATTHTNELAGAAKELSIVPNTEHRTHRPLLQDRIAKSHSRPYVSHDNPYSEAQFKTLNFQPGFPSRFGSLADARAHYAGFFTWYNQQHRHSCIGMTTPESVHTAVPPRSASSARQRWKHLQTHAKPL
jgi:transposase InsO family protein